ncbi:MAG: FkbM family methyltransferase [Cellvibrionaceae bacterium]
MSSKKEIITNLCNEIRRINSDFSFNIVEVGARPLDGEGEIFYHLAEFFPGSKFILFEPDDELCKELNEKSSDSFTYYPYALGENDEEREFYNTQSPLCSSLYKPNKQIVDSYNGLDMARLKDSFKIRTRRLDDIVKECGIPSIDFVKIDVQGAELDIFKGGSESIKECVAIISEVEFIPIYEEQPLFGDVCTFLDEKGLMFHKFFGTYGRTLKPVMLNNDQYAATQDMWTDAFFMKNIFNIGSFSDDQLLKLALLAYLYDSPDVAYNCFYMYDHRNDTALRTMMS